MKKIIYKYPLNSSIVKIQMPVGAKILCVQDQYNTPTLWAEVDIYQPTENRVFSLILTGEDFETTYKTYIGTCVLDQGSYVVHIYETKIKCTLSSLS